MNFYDENSTYEMMENYEDEVRDILYLKELYPLSFVNWQRIVDEECDKMEYDGSIMFDEFPDKERLLGLVNKVYDKAKEDFTANIAGNQDQEGMPSDKWMRDFMSVLLISEMMRRRSRRRIGRRGFC